MKILTFLIALIMLPSVFGIMDCMTISPLTSRNLPCNIISTFPYPGDCDQYQMILFNATPEIVGVAQLSDYGGGSRCNVTFNESYRPFPGSYTFNITGPSQGDSGRLNLEVGSMIGIVIAFLITITFFIGMGILNFDMDREKNLKRYVTRWFAFGMAMTQLALLVGIIYSNQIGTSINLLLKIYMWTNILVIGGMGIIAIFNFVVRAVDLAKDTEFDEDSNRKFQNAKQ